MLEGRKILIGISGSIAAYKIATLTRLFVKAGAQVKVVMTPAAHDFVTPVTLATLSKNPVNTAFVKNNAGEWTNHVELGLWADIFLIAPASANTIAKMAHGICDNLLLATYLSARCPVMFAPAMDLDMLAHTATQKNIAILQGFGNKLIEPNSGELASGLEGKGRMAEPEEIFQGINSFFNKQQLLKGKTVLITAGPTYEHIDPVRFIGNHSSGKMGFAIADAMAAHGAKVLLVAGPSSQQAKNTHITRINVTSAAEMFEECMKVYSKTEIAILCAAVADYAPVQVSTSKIKKAGNVLNIELHKTKDILKELGKLKRKKQLLIGFALETDNEEANALKKMKEKNLDFIVLNSLNDKGAGFGFDTNQISILHSNGTKKSFGLKPKKDVAQDIVEQIIQLLHV